MKGAYVCCNQPLAFEGICGTRVYRVVGKKRHYRAKCLKCQRTQDVVTKDTP